MGEPLGGPYQIVSFLWRSARSVGFPFPVPLPKSRVACASAALLLCARRLKQCAAAPAFRGLETAVAPVVPLPYRPFQRGCPGGYAVPPCPRALAFRNQVRDFSFPRCPPVDLVVRVNLRPPPLA